MQFIIYFLCLIFFIFSFEVYSDELKLQLGYWDGKYKTEIEKRFQQDDLLDGAPDGITRLNQRWRGHSNSFLFPLGVVYSKDYSKWTLVTRGNYFHRSFNYKYTAWDTFTNFTRGKTEGGYSSDYELDFGYKRSVWKEKIFLTGRIGLRSHVKNFGINELTLGSNTLFTTWNADFMSYSNHFYLGGEILYKLNSKISFLLDFVLPIPNQTQVSSMKYNLDRIGNYINRTYIELNDMKSSYIYDLSRFTFGIEYTLNQNWNFQFGYRTENTDVSYPNLKTRPIRLASGGTFTNFSPSLDFQYLFIEEYLDKQNYKKNYTSSQQGLFFSTSYKFDLTKGQTKIRSKK
jgi:hypothetical protein